MSFYAGFSCRGRTSEPGHAGGESYWPGLRARELELEVDGERVLYAHGEAVLGARAPARGLAEGFEHGLGETLVGRFEDADMLQPSVRSDDEGDENASFDPFAHGGRRVGKVIHDPAAEVGEAAVAEAGQLVECRVEIGGIVGGVGLRREVGVDMELHSDGKALLHSGLPGRTIADRLDQLAGDGRAGIGFVADLDRRDRAVFLDDETQPVAPGGTGAVLCDRCCLRRSYAG